MSVRMPSDQQASLSQDGSSAHSNSTDGSMPEDSSASTLVNGHLASRVRNRLNDHARQILDIVLQHLPTKQTLDVRAADIDLELRKYAVDQGKRELVRDVLAHLNRILDEQSK